MPYYVPYYYKVSEKLHVLSEKARVREVHSRASGVPERVQFFPERRRRFLWWRFWTFAVWNDVAWESAGEFGYSVPIPFSSLEQAADVLRALGLAPIPPAGADSGMVQKTPGVFTGG